MKNLLAIFVFLGLVFATDFASARQSPRPIATDSRIKVAVYNPDEVFVFTGHYGFQSTIQFEDDEEILTMSAGNTQSWQIKPSGNRIFLKPVEKHATTNMTVITSKRKYLFELHAKEARAIEDDELIFVLRFVYPSEGDANMIYSSNPIATPDLEENPGKYNFNYTMTGPEFVAPIRIFDDGEFTFFEFRDKNAEVPAFFLVNPDGTEAMINYRVMDKYIVVERVAPRYTLRRGSYVVCVYNESMPFRKIEKDD